MDSEWTVYGESFSCAFCDFQCPNRTELQNHNCLQVEYQDMLVKKVIECEVCGRFFQNYNRFYEHHTKDCLALKWQELQKSHQLLMTSESYR